MKSMFIQIADQDKRKFLYYCFFPIHIASGNSKLHRQDKVADFAHRTALRRFCYSYFDKKTPKQTMKQGREGAQKITTKLFFIQTFLQ